MPERDDQGRWLAGSSGNPRGKNGWETGWTPYGVRLRKWLLLSFNEVQAIASDPARLGRLSVLDLACLLQARGMIEGDGRWKEREAALDRIEGKPKQTAIDDFGHARQSAESFTLVFATPEEEAIAVAATKKKLLGEV